MKCPHCQAELTASEIRTLYARLNGSATSEKKRASSAANGKKGGRPKGSKNKIKPIAEVDGFQIYEHATGTENE